MHNIDNKNKDKEKREQAILVAIRYLSQMRREVEVNLDELSLLAATAGAEVVARLVQERIQIDPTYFIGKGKAKELSELVKKRKADVVIFDDDLSPAQTRNLENLTEIKVLDRSGLILDIFAHRAKTKEAKTQVELAQLQYLLPRLTRRWTHLSRQEAGIGTRGPGETQLETDRRLIQKRISLLTNELEKIKKQRDTRRKGRKNLFKIAFVGYTNSGKSTLLHALTNADVLIEDRLFVTLDSTIRSFDLDNQTNVLLIDTVGFIRKLPHHLIASFHSTLEEAITADLLLHIVDVSQSFYMDHITSVNQVLQELQIEDKASMLVFNKVDLCKDTSVFHRLQEQYPSAVFISAKKGYFLQKLIQKMKRWYKQEIIQVECLVKSHIEDVLTEVGNLGIILDTGYKGEDFYLKFQISRINYNRLKTRSNNQTITSIKAYQMEMN